jgi:hypothetical protein
MSDRTRVEVAQSDIFTPQGIFESATRILSAFITSKQFSDKQEQAFLDKSVFLAMELAKKTDRQVLMGMGEKEKGGPGF